MIWYSEVGQMSEMVKTEQAKEEGFRLVIVTGMSGGGKTQASRYLEDLGYFCVDNLPPVFIPKFVELCKHSGGHVRKVVLVVDTRSREFFDTFVHTLNDMHKDDVPYEMLFMDASDPAIIRRICPVIDSVTAIVISDLLAQRYGTDVFCPADGKETSQ